MYPNFYKQEAAAQLFLPRYELIAQEVVAAKRQGDLGRDALFIIDAQVGFCMPGANLYVPGAENDVARLCEFIYRNKQSLAKVICSLDTHYVYQIFHSAYWRNEKGEMPEPYTIITYEDVIENKWQPIANRELALDYLRQLEEASKYQLCIWPYHTMLGSVDHALQPILSESVFYQALFSNSPTEFILKGEEVLTENYSVCAPEVTVLHQQDKKIAVGEFNMALVEKLLKYDRVFIAGEASSHCVKATVEDILAVIKKTDPRAASKLYLLADCMSPVPALPGADFPQMAEEALQKFAKTGVHVVCSKEF
ncbi:MAG TPA: nicotinamidase [Candidatus Avacidaminococcus intestinavium]|uniref:Nicotinamidase n=1 Tax=Candidatus Avacidaminococcus intestinavium TaxID=2840684 RepID=A0A9D1MN72_9FIRM|nr:nicotinamidase [Candidatus Avacidaminococcus intestinavium]